MTATTHPIRTTFNQAALVTGAKPEIHLIKRQIMEGINGLSCTEIYRRIAADNFPKQVTLGSKCAVWVEDEIYGWMSDRIAESREVAA